MIIAFPICSITNDKKQEEVYEKISDIIDNASDSEIENKVEKFWNCYNL